MSCNAKVTDTTAKDVTIAQDAKPTASAPASNDDFSGIVRSYWEASRSTGRRHVESYFADMPSDFGVGDPDSEVPAAQDPASGDPKEPVGHGVGPSVSFRELSRAKLKWMADNIRKERYRLLEVVDTSRSGDRALVDVRYGNEKVHYRRALLLLRKVDGEWKIFMLTDRATLEMYDPNFAAAKNYL